MPPPLEITSSEKSSREKPGSAASALNSVLTAGKMWILWPRSVSMKPGMSRGLGTRMFRWPMRAPSMKQAVSAKM